MPAPHRDSDDTAPLVVDLDWRSVVAALATFVVVTAIFALIAAAPQTITWCVIASLLALALNPLVSAVQMRLGGRRAAAVGAVLAGLLVATALLLLVLGPPAIREARSLEDDIPQVVDELDDLPLVGDYFARNDIPAKVQNFIEDLPSRLGADTSTIESAARSVVGGVVAAMATIILAVSLLLDGNRLLRAARRVVPIRHRERTDRMADLFYRVVGKYFAGSLFVAIIAGITVLIAGLVLGVPLTPLLAVWVAVFDLVPQIGGAAGGVPFVLLAFAQGATTGVIAAIFFVLYLQFENHVLQPLIVGEAVNLSPPATMVAALIGVQAAGVPGALVAVPLLGVGKAFYTELRPCPVTKGKAASDESGTGPVEGAR